uniref:Putative secreted protein n=1 Tax=Anopheles triannulatus TaxID=58253 RepID=A0A2M4B6N8_9DIPT
MWWSRSMPLTVHLVLCEHTESQSGRGRRRTLVSAPDISVTRECGEGVVAIPLLLLLLLDDALERRERECELSSRLQPASPPVTAWLRKGIDAWRW